MRLIQALRIPFEKVRFGVFLLFVHYVPRSSRFIFISANEASSTFNCLVPIFFLLQLKMPLTPTTTLGKFPTDDPKISLADIEKKNQLSEGTPQISRKRGKTINEDIRHSLKSPRHRAACSSVGRLTNRQAEDMKQRRTRFLPRSGRTARNLLPLQ